MVSSFHPGSALVPAALVRLAEPVIEGRLTGTGFAGLRREGCELPPYDVVDVDRVYVWAEP